MSDVVHAEWTKLRTLPGPGWLLLAAVALTAAVGAAAAQAHSTANPAHGDSGKYPVPGV